MDKNSNGHGLAGAFLRAAAGNVSGAHYVGVDVARPASDHSAVVCPMECADCGIVTPHEYIKDGWSCACCGTVVKLRG